MVVKSKVRSQTIAPQGEPAFACLGKLTFVQIFVAAHQDPRACVVETTLSVNEPSAAMVC